MVCSLHDRIPDKIYIIKSKSVHGHTTPIEHLYDNHAKCMQHLCNSHATLIGTAQTGVAVVQLCLSPCSGSSARSTRKLIGT